MCLPSTVRRVFVGVALVASLMSPGRSLAGPSSPSTPGDSVDLRPAFKKWGLTPRVQGKRNTCSVFTVAGALEYAAASKTNRTPRFSVEFLNWASNQAVRDNHDGSFFSDLWRGFTIYGACPEQECSGQFDPRGRQRGEGPCATLAVRCASWINGNRNTRLTETVRLTVKGCSISTAGTRRPLAQDVRAGRVCRWRRRASTSTVSARRLSNDPNGRWRRFPRLNNNGRAAG
jgi:hypothetical protein